MTDERPKATRVETVSAYRARMIEQKTPDVRG